MDRTKIKQRISLICSISSRLENVKDLAEQLGAEMWVFERDDSIELSKIVFPKDQRGGGKGTKIMKALIEYADKVDKTIVLTPSSDFGGSKARLTEFYQRFGFVPNKGRNKDYRFSETMLRRPQVLSSIEKAARIGYTGNDVRESKEWLKAYEDGIDLSLSARYDRARKMGFDINTIYYHASADDWFNKSGAEFSPHWSHGTIYFALSEKSAKKGAGTGRNKRVGEFFLKLGNSRNTPDKPISWDVAESSQRIKGTNYDSIFVKDEAGVSVAVKNPNQIRSINAVFDDRQEDSGKVLASKEVLLAPNGRPSNLNPVQWRQVRTKEFKRWFGDWEKNPRAASKVLDENGEPRVVYHSTNYDFAEFNTNIGYGVAGKGAYVTTLKPGSDDYGVFTMPVFIRIQRPADFSAGDHTIDKKAQSYGLEPLADLSGFSEIEDWSSELKAHLIADGYDGAELKGEGSAQYLVAYSPNQIKSAIGNTGKFSPKSNDITATTDEVLLAPNGKPSRLNAMQYRQVRTPEFKKWFGDWENDRANSSKVLDSNGEPMVMYHGTRNDFTSFDLKMGGSGTLAKDSAKAMFFTSSKAVAEDFVGYLYTHNVEKDTVDQIFSLGGNIIPVFLNVRDPTVYNMEGGAYKESWMADAIKQARKDKSDSVVFITMADGSISTMGRWKTSNVVAVFKPNQIKSAIGNTGKFSPKSKDITASVTKLLAPNGKPSNLNPTQYKQVRTKEFKQWFGDWETQPDKASKVLDANGEPRVVYHGSPVAFEAFRGNSWFTTDPKDADTYTTMQIGDTLPVPQMYPVFLCIKNPKYISHYILKTEAEAQLDKLKRDGGFIIKQGDRFHFVVKNPSQVKSAIGNSGKFSKTSDNITAGYKLDVSRIKRRVLAATDYRQDYLARYDAMEDFVKEAKQRGSKVTKNIGDATVTVYHGTSEENADKIRQTGKFRPGSWFAPSKSATTQHSKPKFGKENTVMEIKVDPRALDVTGAEGEFYAEGGLVLDREQGFWKSENQD